MEDEKLKLLRKAILETQKDTTLSPQEKARRLKLLMSGKSLDDIRNVQPTTETSNSNSSDAKKWGEPSEEEKQPSYRENPPDALGCKHYYVGCKIRAACCGKFYVCRLCHDEIDSSHKIDRFATEEMMCMHCGTVQPIAQNCNNTACGKQLARYYCAHCKFHDDTPNKNIYHCPDCGLCRVGKGIGIDFFHCKKCNLCLGLHLQNNHKCVENTAKSDCPICLTDLFASTNPTTLLDCGHALHVKCLMTYQKTNFVCPLCSKSIVNMADFWTQLDNLVEAQPMPEEYAEAKSELLCNDCEKKSEIKFHFVGLKCPNCGSYNTKPGKMTGMPRHPPLSALASTNTNNSGPSSPSIPSEPPTDDSDSSSESDSQ